MKRAVISFLLVLVLLAGIFPYAFASEWDTNAGECGDLIILGDDEWVGYITIEDIEDKGYCDGGDGLATLVYFCTDPCRVTVLQDVSIHVGGCVLEVTIVDGIPVHGDLIEPTHENPVYDADFDAYINGSGTYWDLPKGIYYLDSVNRSQCMYLVVGDALAEEVPPSTEPVPTEPAPTESTPTVPPVTEHTHTYSSTIVDADCENGGYTKYVCGDCGDTYVSDRTEALGHNWIADPQAVNGQLKYTCANCGNIKYEDAPTPSQCEHTLSYKGKGATITQTCTKSGCDHRATVTVSAGSTVYTGEKLGADIAYSSNWHGEKVTTDYSNPVGPGNCTVKITVGGATASVKYLIKASTKVDLSKYLSTKQQTFSTIKGSYNFNSTDNKYSINNLDIHDLVDSLTEISLRNATEDQKQIVKERLAKLLKNAKYRSQELGGKTSKIKEWPLQNADKSGTSVYDSGLGMTVSWEVKGRGCLAYARFCSAYLYGTNGVANTKTTENSVELRTRFRKLLDPGETISYHSGYDHKIVFLGESADGQGFYFLSYGGGKLNKDEAYHNIHIGYFSFNQFQKITGGDVTIYDTNGHYNKSKKWVAGSYYNGTAREVYITKKGTAQLNADCPVEMIVSLGSEALDSRKLQDGQSETASFGSMTATGPVGGDRHITLQLNDGYWNADLQIQIIGTSAGSMNLTITQIHEDENGEMVTDIRQFKNVPVTASGTAEITSIAPHCDIEMFTSSEEGTYIWRVSHTDDAEECMYRVVDQPVGPEDVYAGIPSDEEEPSVPWLRIGLITGAIAICCTVIVVIILAKRKKTK